MAERESSRKKGRGESFIWLAFAVTAAGTFALLLFATIALDDAALHTEWLPVTSEREVTEQSEYEDIVAQIPSRLQWTWVDNASRRAMWDGHRILVVEEEMSPVTDQGMDFVIWGLLIFMLPPIAATALTRRNVRKEAVLGSLVGVGGQLFLWAGNFEWELGRAFGASIYIGVEGGATVLPVLGFLIIIPLTYLAVAMASAELAGSGAEHLTQKTRCRSCGTMVPIESTVTECPSCDKPLSTRGVQWGAAVAGVTLTVLGFVLVLGLLGEPLHFMARCDRSDMTDECRQIRSEYYRGESWMAVVPEADEDGQRKINFFHKWKYILMLSPLFLIAPLVLAWRLRRGALATAGAVIPLAWFCCSVAGGVILSSGVEVAGVWMIQHHIIAIVPWAVAGFIGALIGHKLHGGREFEAFDVGPVDDGDPA